MQPENLIKYREGVKPNEELALILNQSSVYLSNLFFYSGSLKPSDAESEFALIDEWKISNLTTGNNIFIQDGISKNILKHIRNISFPELV